MNQELWKIVNSAPIWIIGVIIVLFVLLQNTLFLRLAKKEAEAINYPKEKLKASLKTGMITGVGPALANIVSMLALMSCLGAPIGWMRLSVIGNATLELGVATIVTLTQGLTGVADPNISIEIVTLILIMMATVVTGDLLVVTIATPSMGKMRAKLIEKDAAWASILSTAVMVGVFGNLTAMQLKTFDLAIYASVLISFVVMFVLYKFVAVKHPQVKKYSLGIVLVVGVVVGALFSSF